MTTLADITRVGVATAQDGGRLGYTSVGVPVAGAWHRLRYERAVQLLTGTRDGTVPAIEILAGALSLRARAELVVAVSGPARVDVDGRASASGTALLVGAGHELVVTPIGDGPCYVTVSGWRPSRTLGSCAVDTFSRLGGAPLSVGDTLAGEPSPSAHERVGWFHRPDPEPQGPLRIVVWDAGLFEPFLAQAWRVHRVARSGVRLTAQGWLGPTVSVESFPVVPGAVQLTPDNEAIVLGPDGGLTGGYPVVGVIATVDLDRVSMLSAGRDVRFAAVEVGSAVRQWSVALASRANSGVHPALLR
jgi:allophanate hydrolase subunit 2